MTRKHLEAIGIYDYWNKWVEESESPGVKKDLEETGHTKLECLNLDVTMLEDLYERTKLFIDIRHNFKDECDLLRYEFNGGVYTYV